ncbi:MAG: universal stress protein [Desulfobacteraceae bacterium]|nr:universal stress protein [Desulfobacteraceae bacterium]
MKKIIAAIDFKDTSQELCYFALDFASKLNAELIFVTVLNDWDVAAVGKISSMGYKVDGDHYSEDIEHDSIEKIKNIIKECGFPEVEKKLVLKSGRPAKEVLTLAVKEKADAVIVGEKTHKDLEHTFEISVSGRIYKKSPITVISFRTKQYSEKLKKKLNIH